MKKNKSLRCKIFVALIFVTITTTSCTEISNTNIEEYKNATHILPIADTQQKPISISQSWSGIKEVKAHALQYVNQNVQFYSSFDDKNLIIKTNEDKWTISYDYLDKSIVDKWAKDNKGLEHLGVYCRFMLEQSIKNNFVYLPNREKTISLVAIKSEYGKDVQAIGGLKFYYLLKGDKLYIDEMEFIPFITINELDNWIKSKGTSLEIENSK